MVCENHMCVHVRTGKVEKMQKETKKNGAGNVCVQVVVAAVLQKVTCAALS